MLINFASGDFYATEHAVVVDVFAKCSSELIALFLTALNLNQYSTATAQPGLSVNVINSLLLPIPPLAEQQRIVAQIETLLGYVDIIDTDAETSFMNSKVIKNICIKVYVTFLCIQGV